jgi:hypothetical protein
MGIVTSTRAPSPTLPAEAPRERPVPLRGRPQLVEPSPVDERRILRRATIHQNVEFLVWLGYIVVVALGIAGHEPWSDEAQAWLLARDHSFGRLIFHAIRYEGSPGLWHALLWLLARLHVSYTGMHWIAGAIAVAGIYVFLRWSPFPLILRILLPFGFWLAYQDAVVARSYVLFAVLAFGAAAILRNLSQRDPRRSIPSGTLIGLAVLLGLIANLSVHGFVASIGLAIVALVLLRRRSRAPILASARAHIAVPALVLCAFWAFAVVTTFPPSDVNFSAGKNVELSVEKIRASLGDRHAKAEVAAHKSNPDDVRPGELTPVPPLELHRTPREAFWRRVARVLSLLTYPVSNFRWFALVAVVLIVIQAIVFRAGEASQVGWIGLLPWLFLVLVFSSMYMAPRHAGMLWESLLVALWLTWPAQPPSTAPRLWLHRIAVAALVLVALGQIWWTTHALWSDIHQPYSGDLAMAKFLHAQPPGQRIAGFYYDTVGPEAYFSQPVYFNQPTAYWAWSRNVRTDQQAPATIATHPDIIVIGGWEWSLRNGNILDDWLPTDPANLNRIPLNDAYRILPYAEAHGYRETHRFCGHAFMRGGYDELLCQIALQPAPLQPAPQQPAPQESAPKTTVP